MADILLSINNMSQKWNSKIAFPQDNYILRVTEDGFAPSKSSGKPMITLQLEVVSPDEVVVGNEKFSIAGQSISPYYQVTKSVDENGIVDEEKTANLEGNVKKLFTLFGLPEPTKEEMENPVLAFKGKCIWALVAGKVSEKRKAPTAEQLARGERQGDVIKNPITGQPLVNYYPEIKEIYGIAPTQ